MLDIFTFVFCSSIWTDWMSTNIPLCKFSFVSFQLYTLTKTYFRFILTNKRQKPRRRQPERLLLFPAQPLRPCCDNCGKKIYVPVIKHLWSQNLVCKADIYTVYPSQWRKAKQTAHWSALIVCELSALLPGSARCHGDRGASRTGRIHSKSYLLPMCSYVHTV